MAPSLCICIFACMTVPKYRDQIETCLATWGQRAVASGVHVYVILGEQPPDVVDQDGITFWSCPDTGDTYASALDKQNRGLQRIWDHSGETLEFVYVCGTDTYVRVDALLSLLRHVDPGRPLVLGGHADTRRILATDVPFFYGGAGFVLSREALRRLRPLLPTMTADWRALCPPELNAAGDVCLAYYGQQVGLRRSTFHARFRECNHRGRVDLTDFLQRHGLPIHSDPYHVCCPADTPIKNIITCHNMSLSDMDEVHRMDFVAN